MLAAAATSTVHCGQGPDGLHGTGDEHGRVLHPFLHTCLLPIRSAVLNWQAGIRARPGCHIGLVPPVNWYDWPRRTNVTDGEQDWLSGSPSTGLLAG